LFSKDLEVQDEYGIHLIASHFGVLVGIMLQCLVWDFENTNGNILDVHASIVGIVADATLD
jgi:hypothetical protein